MAVMTLLLAAEDAGIGALLFGVFRGEAELRAVLGVPPEVVLLGAVALGYPSPGGSVPGRSAGRLRRPVDEFVHRGRW
jgi:nitroreductase